MRQETQSEEGQLWRDDYDVVYGEDRVLEDSSVSIFISILIITICFLAFSVLIIIFIKHRAFFQQPNKSKLFPTSKPLITFSDLPGEEIGLRATGYSKAQQHSDNSRFVVNITGGNTLT